jgi:dolichol-phosphate mannosyltransferase
MTNAFKAYRTHVIRACGPYHACHFNITIEMSISALIHRYSIATIPIRWYGRTWGSSKLRLRAMGRRYLATLLKLFFENMLIADDLMTERLAQQPKAEKEAASQAHRLDSLERRLKALEEATKQGPSGERGERK